jgi:DNA-binding transcriptional MerR regulator
MEPERRYTLAELAEACASALDALGIAARNGQVRDRPDARTIRYYTALGLVDRPAEMTGRIARYGDRHLLQVLAVKAMQAGGASLADVQRALVGASTDELGRAIGPGLGGALAAAGPAAAGTDRAFWRTPPARAPAAVPLAARPGPAQLAPASPGRPRPGSARPASARPRSAQPEFARPGSPPPGSAQLEFAAQPGPAPSAAAAAPPGPPRRLVAVPLAAGATLLIEDAGAGDFDAEALQAAAAPLLAHLSATGLLPGAPT